MNYNWIIYLLLIILIVYLIYTFIKTRNKLSDYENFDSGDLDRDPRVDENKDPFLYPLRSDYCRSGGLQNAIMPKLGCLPGKKCDPYANCRCVIPRTNQCAECWKDINVSFHNYITKKRIKSEKGN